MLKVCILGAGWAGLLCSYEIKKLNPDAHVEIYERERRDNLGGLLRSEVINGHTFDIGGPHILFSRNKEILKEVVSFLGENVRSLERKSFIHYEGKLIQYPFENGLFSLDGEQRAKFGEGLINAMIQNAKNPNWVPTNFMDWIYGFFGNEMASKYLEPYNRKIWKRDPNDIDADWVFSPGRVPFPELSSLIRSVAGIPTTGNKEQADFYYPRRGGINALYNSLLRIVEKYGVKVRCGEEVKGLAKRTNGKWTVNGLGEYDKVISTLPLNEISSLVESPTDISNNANSLDFNQVVVTGISINKPGPEQHAVYVPDNGVNFHRYTWMSSLTSDTPEGKSNIISEVTVPKGIDLNLEENISKTIEGFANLGVIKSDGDVDFIKSWPHKYGYPVYTKGNRAKAAGVLDYLREQGIYSVGRWGSWEYWNTDKVFEAVKNIIRDPLFQG